MSKQLLNETINRRIKLLTQVRDRYRSSDYGLFMFLNETISDLEYISELSNFSQHVSFLSKLPKCEIVITCMDDIIELASRIGALNISWECITETEHVITKGITGHIHSISLEDVYITNEVSINDESHLDEDLFQFSDFKFFVPDISELS